MKSKYPLLSSKNIPAYAVVMGIWIIASLISAFLMRHVSDGSIGWTAALVLGFASVMAGMGIMFGASAVNLKNDVVYITPACKVEKQQKLLRDGFAKADVPMGGNWKPVSIALKNTDQVFEEIKKALEEV